MLSSLRVPSAVSMIKTCLVALTLTSTCTDAMSLKDFVDFEKDYADKGSHKRLA